MTNLIQRFYYYQKVRFPLIIISLSLLPALLSTTAVLNIRPSHSEVIVGFVAALSYLLHIRIIDEQRDIEHDNIHHYQRPIQQGIISLAELKQIDYFIILLILSIAFVSGIYSFLISILMLGYSFFASQDFFIKQKIRQHFFLYNAVNTFQTLLMQIFLYTYFAFFIPLTNLIIFHFFFTSLGTIIFEFARKIKIPGADGTGKDTYTWHLGFNNSIFVYLFLTASNVIFFYLIINFIHPLNTFWLLFSISFYSMLFCTAVLHLIKKNNRTEQLMQLSFILIYLLFNVLIYQQYLKN